MTDVSRTVVEAAADLDAKAAGPGTLTLSTGAVVRAVAIRRSIFMAIVGRFTEPAPPHVTIADTGRTEENPDDPDYVKAVKRHKQNLSLAFIDASLLLGTEIVSTPDGFPDQNDADWLEERRLLNLSSGESAKARRLDWLKHKVAPEPDDQAAIMTAVARLSGTSEADVLEAAKSAGRSA